MSRASPFAFPEPPPPADLAAALELVRHGRLGCFEAHDMGGLDLALHVLASAGCVPAMAERGDVDWAAPSHDYDPELEKRKREKVPAPEPCRMRAFALPGERQALACLAWKEDGSREARALWACWRTDQPGNAPFFRMGDFADVELLKAQVMAAALPHPEALSFFEKARGRALADESGDPLPEPVAELHARVAAWLIERELPSAPEAPSRRI